MTKSKRRRAVVAPPDPKDRIEVPPALLVRGSPRASHIEAAEWAAPVVDGDTANRRADVADDGKSHVLVHKVRGFRACVQIERLHRTYPDLIAKSQVEAAELLTNDDALAQGARTGNRKVVKVDDDSDYGALDRQLDAQRRVRDAMASLGPAAAYIVVLVVLNNQPLAAIATIMGKERGTPPVDTRRASERVAAAMTRLVEHYQEAGRLSKPRPRAISSGYGGAAVPEAGMEASEREGRWRMPVAAVRAPLITGT